MRSIKYRNIFFSFVVFIILAYILYWNFLPIGYESHFNLDVGSINDTNCMENICLNSFTNLDLRQSYGKSTWRSVVNNNDMVIELNSKLDLKRKDIYLDYLFNITDISHLYYKKYLDEKSWEYMLFYSSEWKDYIKINEYENPFDDGYNYILKMHPVAYYSYCDNEVKFRDYFNIETKAKNKLRFYVEVPENSKIDIDGNIDESLLYKVDRKIGSYKNSFTINKSGYYLVEIYGKDINSITTNANHVVFLDSIDQLSWNTIYVKPKEDTKITFYSDVSQHISVSGMDMFSINGSKSLWLDKGEYFINSEKGSLNIDGLEYFTFDRKHFTNLETYFSCLSNLNDTIKSVNFLKDRSFSRYLVGEKPFNFNPDLLFQRNILSEALGDDNALALRTYYKGNDIKLYGLSFTVDLKND